MGDICSSIAKVVFDRNDQHPVSRGKQVKLFRISVPEARLVPNMPLFCSLLHHRSKANSSLVFEQKDRSGHNDPRSERDIVFLRSSSGTWRALSLCFAALFVKIVSIGKSLTESPDLYRVTVSVCREYVSSKAVKDQMLEAVWWRERMRIYRWFLWLTICCSNQINNRLSTCTRDLG